ncbi:MAG: hypothetical protein U0K16_04825 [Evtepia sp.]|nr:hypothetical protein [Evtepia sp.]
MRKELEAFIEESFAGLPPSPETEQAKAQVRKQLEADAAVYRAKGMAPWAADQHAMMRFGAVAGARESVARLHRRAIRARFRRRYPKLVKGGILTLTIGPIAAAILWGDADHMVQTLVWWTICVIAIVTYVIVVEYLDYRYQKEEKREAQQAQEEQAK